MTQTKFSQFFAIIVITLLVSGCASPVPALPSPTAIPTVAPTATQTADAQLSSQIDGIVNNLVELGKFSGSVFVARDGKVIISKGYGMANYELDVPNTPQTKFHVASITKQFTAMAILQLQQQGKLNVQDPICKYIPDCPEAWQPITIHHLLTHTSGIHDYSSVPANYTDFPALWEAIVFPASPIQIIALFRDRSLDSQPGKIFSYSNSGYFLLGYIIEQVSGQPYGDFLQKNIFEPLQMANTGYYDNQTVIKNRAAGYNNSTTNAHYSENSFAFAAGGLYSTVEDLSLCDQALYTDKILSQPLLDEMFSPQVSLPSCAMGSCYNTAYGYGWVIGKQFNHKWIWHPGLFSGFSSEIARYPDDKVTIIVLSNFQNVELNINAITITIGRLIFEGQ